MQRFALTLVQGARGSGKSTLLDAAFASADEFLSDLTSETTSNDDTVGEQHHLAVVL